MFIIETKGFINKSENSMRRLVEMLFGPQAFDDFKLPIIIRSSYSVQGFTKILLLFGFTKYDEKYFFD